MRTSFLLAALTGTVAIALPVAAQISDAEVDSLREVGRREGWTFTIAANPASKRPLEQLCGLANRAPDTTVPVLQFSPSDVTLPKSFDWRKEAVLTPVKDQGGCGSCWAFANHGVLESVIKIKDGVSLDLSEQWLVSCNVDYWSCERGGIESFKYSVVPWAPSFQTDQCGRFGVVLESSLPYTANTDPCYCQHDYSLQHLLELWGYVYRNDLVPSPDLIKRAILQYGPVYATVYATRTMILYEEGIYNSHVDEDPNHAIVLVGWDDNLGSEGAWILRNSWGTSWGMNGYMYIEYGCSNVGMRASWVDYYFPEIAFWADTAWGWVPMDVRFGALSNEAADSWSWDFGDGTTGSTDAPSHTYSGRGCFDVKATLVSDGEIFENTKEMFIIAIADTVLSQDVEAGAGDQVMVTLSAHNSAPVRYFKIPVVFASADLTVAFDSFSTDGCRTAYFERQEYLHYDPWFGRRLTLKLVASDEDTSPKLPPGEGDIVKLFFTLPATARIGASAPILLEGYDSYVPEFHGDRVSYEVPAIGCRVTCGESCCQKRGDIDRNGTVDEADIVYFIEWAFLSGPPPVCADEAEVTATSEINIDDLLFLIDYVHGDGPIPPECP